jgi:choline dehydrogenase-like flavoprotein
MYHQLRPSRPRRAETTTTGSLNPCPLPPFHVIIIGAGTGGLGLAQGLKRAGISVGVYERDRTRADGLQGYRVGIDADGKRACAPTSRPSSTTPFWPPAPSARCTPTS